MAKTQPLAKPEPITLRDFWQELRTDTGMLQVAGFVLHALAVTMSGGFPRYVWLVAWLPINVFVVANCFREKYVGPIPELDEQDRVPSKTRDEAVAKLPRLHAYQAALSHCIQRRARFQLVTSSVFVFGELLALIQVLSIRLHWPLGIDLWALTIGLWFSVEAGRALFRREAKRQTEAAP